MPIFSGMLQTLEQLDWKTHEAAHRERLDPVILPFLEARSQHIKQPVADFLFSYYSFRPTKLLSWNPGFGSITSSDWQPCDHRYTLTDAGWELLPQSFPENRTSSLHWIINYQKAILDRPPAFGCYGLHEWAMVYKSEDIRHEQVPLRLSDREIADFVDSQNICCSHYDAFRFFTKEARPLNKLQPESENRIALDQGGCIHANMDLYKWAYKFFPWMPSTLITQTFLLAWETRKIDMMASPYDLRDAGLNPIRIETPEGRDEYRRAQIEIAEKARPLRKKLVDQLQSLADWIS